jgi:hypothetical protein
MAAKASMWKSRIAALASGAGHQRARDTILGVHLSRLDHSAGEMKGGEEWGRAAAVAAKGFMV